MAKRLTDEEEKARVMGMYEIENCLHQSGYTLIAGVDEAGRGPLAGPVYAAAVILPENAVIRGINDSKKLSEKRREELYDEISGMTIPHETVVKGDSKSASIAAASILAKVSRDRFIRNIAEKYPEYGFAKHKGYGTKEHIDALKKYGACEIHRKSFLTKILGENV